MRTASTHTLCFGIALLVFSGSPYAALATEPDIAGTWTWKWKDAQNETHRHVLEVKGQGATLSARERFDDQEAVKVTDLKIKGKKVTFTVLRGNRRSAYSGELASEKTINGDVTVTVEGEPANEYGWTASREPVKSK